MLLCLSLMGCSLYAQSLKTGKFIGKKQAWEIKRVGLAFGADMDMLSNLNANYFEQIVRGNEDFSLAGVDFDENYAYSGICENPHIRLQMALNSTKMRNVEVLLGLAGIFNRNDGISYYNTAKNIQEGSYEYLNMTNFGNEVSAELSIAKRGTLWNTFTGFIGVGTNIGYTFGNRLSVNGSSQYTVNDWSLLESGVISQPFVDTNHFYENFQVRDGIAQRAYLHGGIGIIALRRLELGLEGRLGLGYRYHFGAPVQTTQFNSLALTARWILGARRQ